MSRVAGIVCTAVCFGFFAAGAAEARPSTSDTALRAAFGNCGDPCVINYNEGGEVQVFQAAARAVRQGARRRVVIDGPCYSACAIFADIARARVCITPRAQFGFHKATVVEVRTYSDGSSEQIRVVGTEDPPHSRDIAGWVRRNGGYPRSGLKMMPNWQAARIWRRCGE